jgi:hypothetical protein
MESRHIPFDAFMTSLESLSAFDTFGALFAGCHGLFNLIPDISQLAAKCLEEGSEPISAESSALYKVLHVNITEWQQSSYQSCHQQHNTGRKAIGEVYRQAMWIFLETAMLGSSAPTPDLLSKIQHHIDALGPILTDNRLVTSLFRSILLWPIIIGGSVVTRQGERDLLLQGMRSPVVSTRNTIRASNVLELLWKDDDPRAFGPYGLYLTMTKHSVNLCTS